ncbi:MAG: TIR domain-containing protein, partial [Chloroflexi bacterium]|nr:TIR domain-containing protein [Chloroflexota bacterium]
PDKDAAAKIYAYLKSNNISPFWCEDLAAGQDYPKLLGEAIRASKSFLLVVSDSSDNSDSVRKETTIAHNSKIPIIPLRIKDILPKNLEYLTANSLFFDAFLQPLDQYLPRLAGDIKKIIGSKAEKKKKIKK